MEDYKPNSHRFREEQKAASSEKRVEKVVTGEVRTKKKNEIRKFADIFIAEDIKSVKSYLLMEVLIPRLKDVLEDLITNGAHMLLRGEAGTRRRSNADYVSYSRYSDRRDDRRPSEPRTRTRFDYDDIIFDSRGEAEFVLQQMDEVLDKYKIVRVADLYDLVGLSQPYTSNSYGWTNLRNADVVRTRDGYVLKMPRAQVID